MKDLDDLNLDLNLTPNLNLNPLTKNLNQNATLEPPTPLHLSKRQSFISSDLTSRYTTVSIPASYGGLNAGPPPGTVAGIVLGSVFGVCIILYLTFLALNPGGIARGGSGTSTIDEEVVVRSRRGGSSRRSDMIEVVEERGGGSRPRSYRRPPSHDRIIVEESGTGTVTSDEAIEVFEEASSGVSSASPAPRRHGRGYRSVDPLAYGGGSSRGSRY